MRARYRVEISAKASRQLAALPRRIQERIDARIAALAEDPRPHGVKKLQGCEDQYRIRIGDYRVIYAIEDDVLLVLVLYVASRSNAYR